MIGLRNCENNNIRYELPIFRIYMIYSRIVELISCDILDRSFIFDYVKLHYFSSYVTEIRARVCVCLVFTYIKVCINEDFIY